MMDNSKIEISAMGKDNTWIRVEAKVVLDSRMEARSHMLDEYEMLKSMYSVDDGKMEALYLEDATATIYSMAGQPEVIKF